VIYVLEKLPFTRILIDFPGVFITRESTTNMKNTTNIRKKSKWFLDMPIWTRRSCLKQETETKNLVTMSLRNILSIARILVGM
jgi:hypothetical protein